MTAVGLSTLALAVVGWIWASAALGAAPPGPSMEVLPKSTGLKYGQTVEIKGHHLPKGSGSVAATICGLQDAAGKTIAKPGADDCAGAAELGKLVILKSWQSNGEFDTPYTLPQSAQTFGKNKRFCDHAHHCALVVADANPNNPAYYVSTVIQFADQQPFGSSSTTTAAKSPKPGSTTTTTPGKSPGSTTPTTTTPGSTEPPTTEPPTTEPTTTTTATATFHGSVSGSAGGGSMRFEGGGGITLQSPSGANPPALAPPPSNPIPPPVARAFDQVCSQLAAAVKQAGGDPSGLLAACAAIESGNGPQQLGVVLESPSLLCAEAASTWQNNQQITDACNQVATGVAPVTSQLGTGLGPVLGAR